MFFYLLVLLIVFGIRYFEVSKYPRNAGMDKRWLCFSWLLLSLIEGLRDFSIGTDTRNYVSLFNNNSLENFELGYQWLNRIVALFTNNATVFLLVIAFLTNGLIIRAIYKISKNISVSLFIYITLYFYFNSFNAVRQYIAISFILTAYTFLREKKYIKSVFFLILAILFHNSALIGIFLFLQFFYFQRSKKKQAKIRQIYYKKRNSLFFDRFIYIIVPVIVFIIFSYGFENAFSMFINLFPKYDVYLETDYLNGTSAVQAKITYLIIFFIYVFFADDDEWVLPLSFAVCIAFLLNKILIIGRFLWYYDIFSIFAMADIWEARCFTRDALFWVRLGIVASCMAFMIYYLSAGVMKVSPYHFIF